MRRLTLVSIAAFLLTLPLLGQVPDPASVDHTTGDFHGCPPVGDVDQPAGAHSDPFLNALKNRDLPPDTFVSRTVTQLINDAPAAASAGRKHRSDWTAAQRASVAAKEKTGIQIIGILLQEKREGKETCNCHDPQRVDYHLWLAESEDVSRAESVVVEISPRLLETHPNWPDLVQQAIDGGVVVRVSGWRTWDQDHPEQLGKTRGTLWEIHPIHKIEVQDDNGDWIDIEQADLGGGGGQ